MKTFKELCKEQKEWEFRNFGEQDKENSVYGMIEEFGELFHSILKQKQGIRGTQEEHNANIYDALGDIGIYFISYCNKVLDEDGIERIDHYSKVYNDLPPSDYKHYAIQCGTNIIGELADIETSITKLIPIYGSLNKMSLALTGLTCLVHMNAAWDEVSKRDWNKNKNDGRTEN